MRRFQRDLFVEECVSALAESDPLSAVRDVVLRAVANPGALEATFPVPLVDDGDDGVLYHGADLLVACPFFPRQFNTGIHNHTVPAVIGVWAGHEDNHLFERADRGLHLLDVRRVGIREVLTLGSEAIHDVHTPATSHSAALHVYLGDITAIPRSRWDDTDSDPLPHDGEQHERRWRERALATGLVARSGSSNRS